MAEIRPDIPGAIGSGLMVLLGAGAIYAARDYSELGAVFPRTVGALLVALGVVYILLVVLGRTRRVTGSDGSALRRTLVAVVMLGWGFALGPLGFLPSGAAAMAALLLIAQHGRWTLRTALLYGLSTSAILLGMYFLFKHALQVPLP
ncbi:MAG: tripartite tricarboxylate transporter TctB family protein [Betaproteobacteria bacterium]